jgi:hypothetical protein
MIPQTMFCVVYDDAVYGPPIEMYKVFAGVFSTLERATHHFDHMVETLKCPSGGLVRLYVYIYEVECDAGIESTENFWTTYSIELKSKEFTYA